MAVVEVAVVAVAVVAMVAVVEGITPAATASPCWAGARSGQGANHRLSATSGADSGCRLQCSVTGQQQTGTAVLPGSDHRPPAQVTPAGHQPAPAE